MNSSLLEDRGRALRFACAACLRPRRAGAGERRVSTVRCIQETPAAAGHDHHEGGQAGEIRGDREAAAALRQRQRPAMDTKATLVTAREEQRERVLFIERYCRGKQKKAVISVAD